MVILRQKYDEKYFKHLLFRDIPNSKRNKNRLKEILKIKKNGRLLEIGCGKGRFINLAKNHFDVEGIDISDYAINSIKPIFGDKVSVKNIEKADFPPNNYDVIVVFNLLEHLKKPPIVVNTIFKSLKKNGILIGSVPNNFGLIGGLITRMVNVLEKTHISTFPPNYWMKLFKKAGFNKTTYFGEITTGGKLNLYIKNSFWKYMSFNLIFVCKK